MRKLITTLLSACVVFSTSHLIAQQNNRFNENVRGNTSQQMSSNQFNEIDWCESYTDSIQKAKTLSRPLLILFTGTGWCPACIKLEREVLSKTQFIQALANRFVFYKAEFMDPSPEGLNSNPDSVLLDRYQVDTFPTIAVIDGNGRLLFKINYKAGGPEAYINEINQKLQASKNYAQPRY